MCAIVNGFFAVSVESCKLRLCGRKIEGWDDAKAFIGTKDEAEIRDLAEMGKGPSDNSSYRKIEEERVKGSRGWEP